LLFRQFCDCATHRSLHGQVDRFCTILPT
jgi:hypothetical protein